MLGMNRNQHIRVWLWCSFALIWAGCPRNASDTATSTQAQDRALGQAASQPDPQHLEFGPPIKRATIMFTGDFKGFQRPCGCAIAQLGGLLRLGTILSTVGAALLAEDSAQLEELNVSLPQGLAGAQPVWLVDYGNFSDPNRRLPGLRAKTHLAALAKLGAAAAVVNSNELALSQQQAEVGLGASPLPLVSCNVTSNIPGLKFEPAVQLAANWYLVGLATEPVAGLPSGQGGWWSYADPLQSVVQVLAELPADANVVLVAVHQPRAVVDQLVQLAVRAVVSDFSLAQGGTTAGLAPSFANPGSRGAKLQLLSFDDSFSAGSQPWFILAGAEWVDDPAVVALLKQQQAELKQFLQAEFAASYGPGGHGNIAWGMDSKYLPTPADDSLQVNGLQYLGSSTCQECHQDEYAVWEASRHAAAWESLVEVEEQGTLDCLECHTTGMREPGGFSPFLPNLGLAYVGCETCHGPGSSHLEWAGRGADEFAEIAISPGSLVACLACHDPYNSPHFAAGPYWEMVAH